MFRAAARLLFCLTTAATMLAVAPTVDAALPGVWTRITSTNSTNTMDVHAVRQSTNKIGVAWIRTSPGNPNAMDLMYTPLTVDGAKIGTPQVVESGWATLVNPSLVMYGGSPSVLFSGIHSTDNSDPYSVGRVYVSRRAGASTWTLGGPSTLATGTAYASENIAATAAGDSGSGDVHVVSAYDSTSVLGLVTDFPDWNISVQNLDMNCCSYYTNLAAEQKAPFRGVLAWYSNATGKEGYYLRQVFPTLGKIELLPGSAVGGQSASPIRRVGVTGRTEGFGGIYSAYCMGYPTCTGLAVHKYGTGSAKTVVTMGDVDSPNITAGPNGRLWVMWIKGNRAFYARSNPSALVWGAVGSTALPKGTTQTWGLSGTGEDAALNLFTQVSTPGSLATWHTRVLPKLLVSPTFMKVDMKWYLTVKVTDAGTPIGSATVRAFGTSGVTNSNGLANLAVPASVKNGRHKATATRSGYAVSTGTARLRR